MNINSMTSYAVVLTFPQQVEKELKDLRDRYNKYVTYSIVPHITLKQPFKSRVELSVVNERLSAVANRTKPFVLILDGVEYFEEVNNVVYVAIKNNKPVADLHADIVRSLEGLVEAEYEVDYGLDRFTPHMTIAEQIPDEVFPVVKKELSSYKANHKVAMDSFSLYNQGEDKIWKLGTIFRLSGE